MHLFGWLLMPQAAVSYGFRYSISLADKPPCLKCKTERTEVQRRDSKNIQRGSIKEYLRSGFSAIHL